MDNKNKYYEFSKFIEQYITSVQGNDLQLNQVARIKADIILDGFHRSLEKSYHKQKYIESFLLNICTLRDDYEKKGFDMAVNGLDTSYRSILFIEIMKELNQLGIADEELNDALSTNIAIIGHSNAAAIMSGFAICIALSEVKEAAAGSQILIEEPKIAVRINGKTSPYNSNQEDVPSKDKMSHKKQVLLLDELGFFSLPMVESMNTGNKGKLLSYLLNRDEKNSTEYVRNLGIPRNRVSKDTNFIRTEKNLNEIKSLLESFKAREFVVTTPPTTTD